MTQSLTAHLSKVQSIAEQLEAAVKATAGCAETWRQALLEKQFTDETAWQLTLLTPASMEELERKIERMHTARSTSQTRYERARNALREIQTEKRPDLENA